MTYEIRMRRYEDGGRVIKQESATVDEATANKVYELVFKAPDATPVDFNGGCKDGVCEINFEKK